MAPMSLKTDEQIEGGDFPKGPLVILSARYDIYAYMRDGKPVMDNRRKEAKAVGAMLVLKSDTGQEFDQFYSIGDPTKYTISEDRKHLDGTTGVPKTSNFATLLNELENKGYPQDRVGDDIAEMLEGLYANWDTVEQQQRTGLASQNQQGGQRVVVVPTEIYQFPWGEAKVGAPKPGDAATRTTPGSTPAQGATSAPAPAPTASSVAVVDIAVELVEKMLASGNGSERKDLSMVAFAYNNDPANKMDAAAQSALMSVMFDGALEEALKGKGIVMEGEVYVKG